jgi:hypothetical protein
MKQWIHSFSVIFFIVASMMHAEGFVAGTLVKTVSGYKCIEDIVVGDYVVCYDDNHTFVERPVVDITKKSADSYVRICLGDEYIAMASDQKLYNNRGVWVVASDVDKAEFKEDSIDVYLLSIAQYHNFFVSHADICAHNFFPFVVGIAAAFGGGTIEIVGVSFGLVGLGALFGYQWQKNKSNKSSITMTPVAMSGGMMPNDPDDEDEESEQEKKKRQRDEARKNHEPLTNKRARELAEKHGYKEIKDPPFNSHNELVFKKDNVYISPDNTGHIGGIWKMIARNGRRIGTFNADLTEMIGG